MRGEGRHHYRQAPLPPGGEGRQLGESSSPPCGEGRHHYRTRGTATAEVEEAHGLATGGSSAAVEKAEGDGATEVAAGGETVVTEATGAGIRAKPVGWEAMSKAARKNWYKRQHGE